MDDALFSELLGSVDEAGRIRRGEAEASRSYTYAGKVLVEVAESGRTVWSLADAAALLDGAGPSSGRDVRRVREALRQSQEGFAELLGISVGTLRGWEQGRREPRGPAMQLLRVVAKHPAAVLDAVAA